MKICTGCKQEKPVEEFIKNGLYRNTKCNPCRLEYQKKINKKARNKQLQKLW